MTTTQCTDTYDVVIMGAGFAGLCQARHLMLKVPDIKIALIEPRPADGSSGKHQKIGESTVEVAAMFLAKELGLYEYLVEKQVPKFGLNFHWPKTPQNTETIDDYYHIWTNRQPEIASFQVDRTEFEQDMLQLNIKHGAHFINGRVIDVDLTSKDNLNSVKVRAKNGDIQTLNAKHVVDAAGRRFIIGKKTDNVLFGPENLYGLNNGASWVRVKNVDRTLFHDGYDPDNTSVSHYYATNHYFGHGHWLWMIPIDTENQQLSIGMMHHHDVIPSKQVNTQEKFLAFLNANHTLLYNLIESGETVDFHHWPRAAHKSKTMFSEDNWYVVGDAACIFDAFYSQGSTLTTFAVESTTEIIRAKLAQEADAEKKREAYNRFTLSYNDTINAIYHDHDKQLGDASMMSWRIYFEYIWWFGMVVPLYIGKWHLNVDFCLRGANILDGLVKVWFNLYEQFNELIEKKANLGLLDCYRADQLIFGYTTAKHFDEFTQNAKYEPMRLNVFGSLKNACFYAIVWLIKFNWKGFGLAGLLRPKTIGNILWSLSVMIIAIFGELVFKVKSKGVPHNTEIDQMREEFKRYEYIPELQPSIFEDYPSTVSSNGLRRSAVESSSAELQKV